jgi:hypothetical protein
LNIFGHQFSNDLAETMLVGFWAANKAAGLVVGGYTDR